MSRRTVIHCDSCGKEITSPIELRIPDGCRQEFGGHKTETHGVWHEKEICSECASSLFRFLFSHIRTDTEKEGWEYYRPGRPSGKYVSALNNDAVALALRFFLAQEHK